MSKEIYVYMDLYGKPYFVGNLWLKEKDGEERATFEYSKKWLENPLSISLEPTLQLGEGKYHTKNQAFFGSINDSAPDRWGRTLMDRMEARKAKQENRKARKLLESDYLLMVDDQTRLGALRFTTDPNGPFLANYDKSKIPPLVELGNLMNKTARIISLEENNEDLQDIFEPGSSLGGARPKASVKDNRGKLYIAKFPSPKDDHDVELWEYIALNLAQKTNINVPGFSLYNVSGKNVLILDRFDRSGNNRVPFLSAMSMLTAKDHETRSYLEIGEALIENSSDPKNNLRELWKRMVFNILSSNLDDHLRNHGFLFNLNKKGWELSPMYDIEPLPTEIKARFLQTSIDLDDKNASIDLAFEVCKEFDLSLSEAKDEAQKIAKKTSRWKKVAQNLKVRQQEIDFMSSAFEHEDLKKALKPRSTY